MNALWPLWATTVGLLLLVLGGLLWPLLREPAGKSEPASDARERLRRLYRTQREELDAEHRRLALDDEDYTQAIEELERRLLAELDSIEHPIPVVVSSWQRYAPAVILTKLLPLGAIALYLQTGDPGAAAPSSDNAGIHSDSGIDMKALVTRLEQRLGQTPDDLEGWIVLARSHETLEDFDAATRAYRRAVDLAVAQQRPNWLQARLYADLADAMASARGGKLDAPVQKALAAALALDPDQPKALALAGTAAARQGDRAGARRHWQRLLTLLEPDSEPALRVQSDLARLDGRQSNSTARSSGLAGTVQLAATLRDKVEPGDTVFIVARAPAAGRMPVAVLRLTAAQLPAKFRLDDSNAMSPDMPLSRFTELTVEARISRSGIAQRQSGQPVSSPQATRQGNGSLVLTIDKIEP